MKRFNVFDAAVVAFVIVLIPIAYGTYLLFRAPKTVITAVKRVEIAKEERRVGGPTRRRVLPRVNRWNRIYS